MPKSDLTNPQSPIFNHPADHLVKKEMALFRRKQRGALTPRINRFKPRFLAKLSYPHKPDQPLKMQRERLRTSTTPLLKYNSVGWLLLPLLMLLLSPSAQAAQGAKIGQRILMIEMTPAMCSIYPSRARMRQCLEGYSLTVSGLDLGYGSQCGRGGYPDLTPLQLRVVNRIMPDASVRNQAWRRYGACSPMRSSFYFRQIVNHASHLQLPRELNTGNSYTVSKSRFLQQLVKLNSGMSASSVDLICQNSSRSQSVLTEIHVCYTGSSFGTCPNRVDNCGSNFIISGGK